MASPAATSAPSRRATASFVPAATGPQIVPDTMSAYAGSDEQLTCLCAGEAVVRGASVWGSVSYTADSATCRAARHAGVAPLTGGTVTLRMLPGEPRYPGALAMASPAATSVRTLQATASRAPRSLPPRRRCRRLLPRPSPALAASRFTSLSASILPIWTLPPHRS